MGSGFAVDVSVAEFDGEIVNMSGLFVGFEGFVGHGRAIRLIGLIRFIGPMGLIRPIGTNGADRTNKTNRTNNKSLT